MKDYTSIVVILDKSASMAPQENKVAQGYNQFVNDQKELGDNASLELVQFDNKVEVSYVSTIVDTKQLSNVYSPFEKKIYYRPNGRGTALFDAIGVTCDRVGWKLSELDESERPDKVLVVIFTDGIDNCSQRYSKNDIAKMIKHQTEVYSWNFVFLGADMNVATQAVDLGLSFENTINYQNDSESGYRSLSTLTTSYRLGNLTIKH